MNWNTLPSELKILSFKDFCIRCDEVYDAFWEYFAPFFDITIYRDYLLEDTILARKPVRQEQLAGKIWEYLMGDLDRTRLMEFWIHLRRNYYE